MKLTLFRIISFVMIRLSVYFIYILININENPLLSQYAPSVSFGRFLLLQMKHPGANHLSFIKVID